MLSIELAFEKFGDKVFLEIGDRKVLFSEMAEKARGFARELAALGNAPFVVCDCADAERYIAVFCACVATDRTIVPFSPQKVPLDELSLQLPDFVFVASDGLISNRSGSGSGVRESGDVYCLFTSGTTGKPKGILVCGSNLEAYVEGVAACIPEYGKARNISAVFSPLFDLFYHDLLLAIHFGLTIQVPTPRERLSMLDYVKSRPIDIWFSTPTLAANILASLSRSAAGLPAQKTIPLSLFCGERLGAGLAIDWADAMVGNIINVYGPTETTIACTAERLDMLALDPETDVSIGKPFGGNRAAISDHGTLVIRGPQVARYLGGEKVEFFDTKDLVKERDGKYFFLGRADGQLKIKGLRIEKEELERVACSVDGVKYAKIQPIESGGLVAGFNVVVVGTATAKSILDEYKKRYGQALIPSAIKFVEEFETGTSGKAKV